MQDKLNLFLAEHAGRVATLPHCAKAAEPPIADSPKLISVEVHCKTGHRVDDSLGRRLALERRLHRLANYDDLTSLPTLARVSRHLSRLITGARRAGRGLAVVSLDLDGLRLVCEAYGRKAAETLIKRAASIVRAVAPANSVVARNGADGFIVVLADTSSPAYAAAGVQPILDAIAVHHNIGRPALRMTASAGIAMFPADGGDSDTLCRNAIAAMHESKTTCHRTPRFHSGNVILAARRQLRLRTDLRHAVENRELTLYYQPQFHSYTGQGLGVEVLARWLRGDDVVVEPGVFIPLAEQTALIGPFGSWALQEACREARRWSTLGNKPFTLSVNVSAHQIDTTFGAIVQRAIAQTDFPANRLELEITESALLGDTGAIIECFQQLKAIGVRIAIDDFGTGYSSLSYLSRLPVDRLKLDKSLVHNMTCHWKDVAILRSVIAMGRDLGIAVIAEGVETEQQLAMLKQLGCSQVQGYLFARPAPPTAAYRMLTSPWGARKTAAPPGICVPVGRSNAS